MTGEHANSRFFVLPGVPKEYKDMMANIALTDIEKKYVSEIIESKIDEEYNKKVNDEGYKENSEIGYDYSRLFRKNFYILFIM